MFRTLFYFESLRLTDTIRRSRKILRSGKLSDYYIKKIIQCFCIDIPASKTTLLLGKNRNTINCPYGIFRQ